MFGTIGLKSEGFVKGIDNAGQKARDFSKKFGAVAKGIGTAAVGMATAAAAVATAIGAIAIKSSEAASRINDLSQVLGLSMKGFQEWDYILKQNGSNIDSLGVAMKSLQTLMVESTQIVSKEIKEFSDETIDAFSEAAEEQERNITRSNRYALDARKELFEEEYDAFENNLEKQANALKQSLDQEMSDFEKASNARIDLIDREYLERLKLVDEEKYQRLKAIDDQINRLEKRNQKEEEIAKQAENSLKRSELQANVRAAETLNERKKAQRDLASFDKKLRKAQDREERNAQIDTLQDQKDLINEEYDARESALREELEAEKAILAEQTAAEKLAIDEVHQARMDALNLQNEEQLKSLKKVQDMELDLLDETLDRQLENIRKINDAQISAMKEAMITIDQPPELSEAFEKLGFTLQDIENMSPEEMFNKTVKALQALPEGADKARLAVDLFGRQGMDLLPVLNQTIEETERMRQAANDLGMVMSEDMIKAGDDFGDALDTVKGMIGGLANAFGVELLPAMTQGLEAFIAFVTGAEGAEESMQLAFDNLISVITEKIPAFIESGSQVILAIVLGIVNALPSLIEAVIQVIPTIITGIAETLPQLIPAAVEVILAFVAALIDNIDLLIDAAIAIVDGISEGIINSWPLLLEKIPGLIVKLAWAIINNIPRIIDAGISIVVGLAKGIVDSIPIALKAIWELITGMLDLVLSFFGIHSPSTVFAGIGKNLVIGLWDGIKSMGGWLWNNVTSFFENIVQGVKDVFKEKSPSKVFGDIGKNVVVGFVNGLESMASTLNGTMDRMFGNAIEVGANVGALNGGLGMSSFGSAAVQPISNISGGDNFYFTIDAKSVEDINRLVQLADRVRQQRRQS